jgi:hypothetical protein
MLGLINGYRIANGAGPLAVVPDLANSALWKSTDMAQNHYFEHDDLARGWQQRFADCGYSHGYDGENIAEGYAGAQQTFDQWRGSALHNRNMLDGAFHAIGIGRAVSPDGSWYWTTDFGGSTDPGATPAPASSGSSSAASPLLTPPLAPPASLPSSVTVGSSELTSTPGDCLRVHAAPSLSSNVSACLPDGTLVLIVAGPVTADGHTWWSASNLGWLAGDLLRPSP